MSNLPNHSQEIVFTRDVSELMAFGTQGGLAEIAERIRSTADQEADAFVEWINNINLDLLPEGVTYSKSETVKDVFLKIRLDPKDSSIPSELRALSAYLDPEMEDDLILEVYVVNQLGNEAKKGDEEVKEDDMKEMSAITVAPKSLFEVRMNKDKAGFPEGDMGFELNLYENHSEFTEWKGERIEWKRPQGDFTAFGKGADIYEMNLAFGTSTVFQDSLRLDLMRAIKHIVEPQQAATKDEQTPSAISQIIEMTQDTEEALVNERREIARRFPRSLMLEIDPMDERVAPLFRSVLADWGISLKEPVLIQAVNVSQPTMHFAGGNNENLAYLVEPFSLTPFNSGFIFSPPDAPTQNHSGFMPLGRNSNSTGSLGYGSDGRSRLFRGVQEFQPDNFYLEAGIFSSNGGGRGLMYRQVELALARTIRAHLSEAYDPTKQQGQGSSQQLGKAATRKPYHK